MARSPALPSANNRRQPSAMAGFSMIEVLIALLVLCIGLLGMVSLQGRGLQLAQAANQRSTAVMLAQDLVEMMRSNPEAALNNHLFSSASSYYKAAGSEFTSTTVANCANLDRSAGGSTIASQDFGCWLQEVQSLLPVTSGLLKSNFTICPSKQENSCSSGSSSVVMIQLAWQDKSGACTDDICYYRLRAEL
ncbi:MAG: type IV pilus modification protein PilV [Pseudomonas sp.]